MALSTYRRTQPLPEVEVQASANLPPPEILTLHSLCVVLGFPMTSACGTTVRVEARRLLGSLLSPVNFFTMETVTFFFFLSLLTKAKIQILEWEIYQYRCLHLAGR